MLQRISSLAVAALFTCGTAVAGQLTGETLQGSYDQGGFSPSNQAVVGAGVEFRADFAGIPFFDIDIDDNGLVTVTDILGGSLGRGAPHLLSFFDVFFSIDPIIGFDLISTSGVSGISQSDLSFTADSFSMQVGSDTRWVTGDHFVAQLRFGDGRIPVPATFLLIGLGLAAAGGVRRLV